MREKILSWLKSPRVYLDGVRLYQEFGHNKVLKNSFNKVDTPLLRSILALELSKLIGISESELANLPRLAKTDIPAEMSAGEKVKPKQHFIDELLMQLAAQFEMSVDDIFGNTENGTLPLTLETATEEQKKAIEFLAPRYAEVPETMKKVIRIREKYPFLKSPECPQEFKLMVHDMFSAYDAYREAYALLSDKNSQDENLKLANTVVENYLQNRQMWEELDHYKEKGEILGQHPIFELLNLRKEIQALSDIDLTKELSNVKTNISKSKKAIEKAETDEAKADAQKRLDKWSLSKAEMEQELKRRKK